ncbi:MAG: hypothetical protein HY859_08520 [Caulobacterales bacterium]|nr:hypothetical protein [Caulobacterales bacterium]
MIRHLALCALLLTGIDAIAAEENPAAPADTAKVERLKPEQWCWTHDLPKDRCTTCDRKLIPALKKANDWCAEHGIAESLCQRCDPKAKTTLDALRPTERPKDAK